MLDIRLGSEYVSVFHCIGETTRKQTRVYLNICMLLILEILLEIPVYWNSQLYLKGYHETLSYIFS